MPFKTIEMRWVGVRQLIMSNVRAVDKADPLVIELQSLTKQRNKNLTKATLERIERIEWELSIYWDSELGLYMPSSAIERCLQDGGARDRTGKKIAAAVFVEQAMVPFSNQTKKNLDDLYANEKYRFRVAVRLPPRTGARVMKTRACVPPGWVLKFNVEYDDENIEAEEIETAAINAGAMKGLGNWRPKYGRFSNNGI